MMHGLYECTRNACNGRTCACAGTYVPVFEKTHALMKRIRITCNGKYTENRTYARRAARNVYTLMRVL